MSQRFDNLESMEHGKANNHCVRKGTTAEIAALTNVKEGDVIANITTKKLLVNVGTDTEPVFTDSFVPIGVIRLWAGSIDSIPSGWLRCNGAQNLIATYPDLHTVVGDKFGDADDLKFRVPDFETDSRFAIGANDDTEVGEKGGESEHVLTVDEMAAHSHTAVRFDNSIQTELGIHTIQSFNNYFVSTGTVGGNQAHENIPPYVGMIFIIKARRN